MFKSSDVWRIVLTYALFGSLWIIFSDTLLYRYFPAIEDIQLFSIIKGLFFISITSLLLYALVARQKTKINTSVKALRGSERRFKFLVENSSDCLVIIDSDGHQKYVSHGAEFLFGYSKEELTGKQVNDIVHTDDLPQILNTMELLKNGKLETTTVRYRHLHKNGTWVDCEAVARSFLQDPVLQGIVANVRDISDRKRAERILRKRNQFISTILDNLPIGLAVHHIDDGTTVYMNNRFSDIYGWPREKLTDVEQFFLNVYPDEAYRQKLKTRVMEDIASGDLKRMSWANIEATTEDGKKKIIEADNFPLYEQNLMISTVQDITESRRLQKQLEQMQKLESIGRLAGGVAHDLNNLLTPVLGYSQILLDEMPPESQSQEAVNQIYNAGIRARDLVQQLLAFSRRQILHFKPVDLSITIQSLHDMLRRTIPADVVIEYFLKPEMPAVFGDRGQIQQVLMNLVINASDAMPNGGKLTIETSLVTLDKSYASTHQGAVAGEFIMIAISDTGCGMDKETARNIFEPFFSTKGEYGTGLGLATVYGIVKQHGGNIWVYSEPGRGTTFKIYLPVANKNAEIEEIAKKATNLQGTETILLAEDAPQVRHLARIYLDKLGYTVIEARNGTEALAVAAEHEGTIHLLFTDVVMPGMNGSELYRKMRLNHPDLQVLYMSGYTDNVIAHRGVLDEGIHFLQKPFDLEKLGRKLREVLADENSASPKAS